MKKIGIISDTHGLLRPEILEILKGCDCADLLNSCYVFKNHL